MTPTLLFAAFCLIAAIWTAIWGWVLLNARYVGDFSRIQPDAALLRDRLVFVAGAVVVAIFAASIYWLPYAFIRTMTLGRPSITVQVIAEQWAWTFTKYKFKAGVPVEFDVTSKDVNHGFGLYDPSGRLLGQVQAMPGYINRLIFTFQEPGTYTVRCLELCGTPHFLMQAQITVTR